MSHEPTLRGVWGKEIKPVALLNDSQIREAIEKHKLLINPDISYSPEAAKYASYEVHAAAEVGRVDFLEDGELEEKVKSQTREIVISPGDTVRLFTAEHFFLPADVFATVTGLGQLYAAGLTVGSTYVDPGTSYRIYLSVSNVSERAVVIPAGAPIGRAQFFVLGEPASTLKRSAWRTDLGYRKAKFTERSGSEDVAEQVTILSEQNARLAEQLESLREEVARGNSFSGEDLGSRFSSSKFADEVRQSLLFQSILIAIIAGILIAIAMPASVWRLLSGENLPPLAKFAIPAIAGGLLAFALLKFAKAGLRYLRNNHRNGA